MEPLKGAAASNSGVVRSVLVTLPDRPTEPARCAEPFDHDIEVFMVALCDAMKRNRDLCRLCGGTRVAGAAAPTPAQFHATPSRFRSISERVKKRPKASQTSRVKRFRSVRFSICTLEAGAVRVALQPTLAQTHGIAASHQRDRHSLLEQCNIRCKATNPHHREERGDRAAHMESVAAG
jgi:hypothetical protein